MYDIYGKMASFDKKDKKDADIERVVLLRDYLSKDWREYKKQLAIKDYIGEAFPPVFVMTAENDFLRGEALPMVETLTQRGIDVTYKKYGEAGEEQYAHIFHCNLNIEEAKKANREQCSFFKSLVK